MILFVRLYTRRVHITSKNFLRKIAPKTSSNDQNNKIFENNTDSLPSSNFQTSCPDYLGIESEENVIAVIPQKHRFQQFQTNDARERFYRTSFGIVRLDAENKLNRHGQYERKVDFVFPHSSSEDAKVSNVSETLKYKNPIHQDLSLANSQKNSALDTPDIRTSDSSSLEKKDIDKNYIDECYFGVYETNNFSQNTTQSEESEKLNFIEKDYFDTLDQSRTLSFEQNSTKYADSNQKNDSAVCSKNQIDDINYIEKDYFESNPENLYIEQNPIESHSAKQNISNYTDVEMNSVFAKNDYTNAVDELSFLDKTLIDKEFGNSLSPNSLNSLQHDELCKSLPYFTENNMSNKDMYNQFNRGNQDDKRKIENEILKFESSDHSVDELKKNSQRQADKINSEKLSFNKIPKNEIISHVKSEQFTKDLNMPRDLLDETVKPFSMENNFKFSKTVSEETDQENQEPTAHDFVEKLRLEEKIPSQIILKDPGKKNDEEKLDSKGFRILKNQVPNLSYFTRDEILNILKQNIVYSDEDLLVLNKPYSLVIHDSQTTKEPCLSTFLDDLAKEIDKQSTNPKLFTVHRLDKETTGCILLARNETMAMHLKALFAQRKIVKKYWIITSRVPDPREGVIDIPISEGSINDRKRMVLHPKLPSDILYRNHSKRGRPAVTTYKVIAESGNAALVEVFPKTGVKHQIRVHFGFGLGCPILGDHKYSHLDKLAPQKLPSDLLQKLKVRQSKVRHIPMHIHAKSVGIPEYFDKRDLFVNIPIPQHFKTNLKRLKFRKKDMIH